MIAADRPTTASARLMVADADGDIRSLPRTTLAALLEPGDLVVANDAATLPASLHGTHEPTGGPIEVRLAGWKELGDPTRFTAICFGGGDHRTPTERRDRPPPLKAGDRLKLGDLSAVIERLCDHPRLVVLRFAGDRRSVLCGLARHGRPIQYSHVPAPLALADVWTRLAAAPVAFEPPSAGFAFDWRTMAAWREQGIDVATLTHAAGISSTGDAALDARLPFDEPYRIPARTAAAIARTRARHGRVVAIGTTVVRALEAAARDDGTVAAGTGVATGRIGPASRLRVVDAILTGVHQPGESHFELLRAFADTALLDRLSANAGRLGYRTHEFGDSMLIERQQV